MRSTNVSDERDPAGKLTDLWVETARGYADAFQSFLDAADAAASSDADAPAEAFQRGMATLTSMQARCVERLLAEMPDAAEQRLDAQTFGQLRRLNEMRWEEELQRLSQVPAELATGPVDPVRLGRLWEGMWAEYLRDLDTLPDDAFRIDVEPLARAWTQVMTGQADEASRQMVERLVDSVAVKARWGGEYYADPDATEAGQTPRECVHEQGRLRLYRYHLPEGSGAPTAADAPPVLVVLSVI